MTNDASQYIADLLDLQVPFAVNIARDGKTLVYSVGLGVEGNQKKTDHAVSSVWHAESGKAGSARQLTSGLYNDRSPAISPDGQTVVFTSDRAKQSESCAIYALSLSGGEPYAITPADNEQSIELLRWSSDGKFIAFLCADEKSDQKQEKDRTKDDATVWGEDWAYNRLQVLHVASREVKTIVSLNEHITDFDWNDKGDHIAFLTQANTEIDAIFFGGTTIYTVSAVGGVTTKINNFPSATNSIAYTATAIHFLGTVTASSVVGSIAVYKVDLDNKDYEYTRVAHGNEDCSLGLKRIGNDVTCYVQNGLEDKIAFVGGRTLVTLPCDIASWDVAYPTDSDEVIIALVKSDINNPAEVYTTTASGGALVKLSNHGAAFTNQALATITSVSCSTIDGTDRLDGVLFTPTKHKSDRGTPAKPLSTVVAIHGGPYYRITNSFNPSFFYFTNNYLNAGYAVMHPNYRGGSGRGESFADKARGCMGTYDEPDIVALTQHCIEKGYINKEQLVVTGWSQGGHLTYLCSVKNGMHKYGWKFKAAVAGAGVTDWDTMSFSADIGFYESAFSGRAAWETDDTDTRSREGSAIWHLNKAAEAKAIPPILMLHGEKDPRVPIEQATAFRRGLQYHQLPFEYVTYPREGHDIKERKHLEDMLKRSLRFVDQHVDKN